MPGIPGTPYSFRAVLHLSARFLLAQASAEDRLQAFEKSLAYSDFRMNTSEFRKKTGDGAEPTKNAR